MQSTERSEDMNSSTKTVHTSEKAYFDTKARQELEGLESGDWLVDPAAHRDTLKLWGFDSDLSGKKVLECGCGTGFFAVLLASTGAQVYCFDLSEKQVEATKKRADLNGVADRVTAKVAAFENLDYEDESFDLIVGKNILHHIPDITEAGKEIRRVLKVGGKAKFYELSANNPILIFFRNHVIGKSKFVPKLGTPDEHPLTKKEIEDLSSIFKNQCRISYPKFRFFGKFDRQIFQQRYRVVSYTLEKIDRFIYIFLPPLRKYSYKILLEFAK
jgi:ubiquinone/menaquinone biosynthesis C-methylase UbiE